MMKLSVTFFLALGLVSAPATADMIDGQAMVIGDNFGFVEGPVWDAANNRFVFTDIPNNKVFAVTLDGNISVIDEDSGYANGLAIDEKGNLWAARHDRKVSYKSPDGVETIVVETYKGRKLNSPNDLAFDANGSIWFTDPPYGINGYGPEKADEEQPVRGVYQITKSGEVILKSGELTLPNGLKFSPDYSTLYVADSADGSVYAFDVQDGKLSNKTFFAKVEPAEGQTPISDGIEVDQVGNVYIAGPGGIGIFTPTGESIDFISVDAGHVSNMEIGGENNDQLLVTAANKVLLLHVH